MYPPARLHQLLRHKLWLIPLWLTAAAMMLSLDGSVELGSLAMILVLAAALTGLWLSPWLALICCTAAVLAFNWQFVPPRGAFSVDLRQHAWLLVTMWAVGALVAWLVGRQKSLLMAAQSHAQQTDLQMQVTERLRGRGPDEALHIVISLISHLSPVARVQAFLKQPLPEAQLAAAAQGLSAEEHAQMQQAMRSGNIQQVYRADIHGHDGLAVPMRASNNCLGAVLVVFSGRLEPAAALPQVIQAVCDQLATHLERQAADSQARQAEQEADAQKLRNTLLASIAHDTRTPLATILGAASSLRDQHQKLSSEQLYRHTERIISEVQHLVDLTDNTLQLARLDTSGVQLQMDWESAEELLGSVAARAKARWSGLRLSVRLEPGLPLMRCDAVLIVQLLNNLIDNAHHYGPADQTIELLARRFESGVLLAVGDRGPGLSPQQAESLFQPFVRGQASEAAPRRAGAGLGLALCRAVAHAHHGRMQCRLRQRGGTFMECVLPASATSPADKPI